MDSTFDRRANAARRKRLRQHYLQYVFLCLALAGGVMLILRLPLPDDSPARVVWTAAPVHDLPEFNHASLPRPSEDIVTPVVHYPAAPPHRQPRVHSKPGGIVTVAYAQNVPVDDLRPPEPLPLPPPPSPAVPRPAPQESLPYPSQPPFAPGNEPELRFHFRAAPWMAVLEWCAREAGTSLHVPEAPPGVFTLLDERPHTVTEAIDVINEHLQRAGFLAIRNRGDLIVLRADSPAVAAVTPYIPLEELPYLGRRALATVAIPVQNGIPQAVAQEVEGMLSPVGRVRPLSSSRRVLVTDLGGNLRRIASLLTASDTAVDLPYFVYHLRNAPAVEVAKAINEFLATRSTRPVAGAARHAVAPEPSGQMVVAEMTTNSLLVRGEQRQIDQILDLIRRLDRNPPQVVIQALLVEVQLGNTDEFGIELGVQDSILFDRSVVGDIVTVTETLTTAGGNQTTNQTIVSQTASPGFNFNTPLLGGNTAGDPGRIGSQGLTNFGVGRVNGDLGYGGLVLSAGSESVNVLLRALQSRFHIDILSRPQIRALDNHEAIIQIGQQVPVVDGVAITAVGSANPVIRQDQAGIILKVTPRISPDGSVLIAVNAEKSAFQLGAGTGVPIYTDATTGNVIEAPVKDVTSAQTAVSVRDGQTIVLGGMIMRDLVNVHRQVPILGDIPILGELFKYHSDKMIRKELLIFLTPRVVLGDAHAEAMKLEEMGRISMPYDDAVQMHGPLTSEELNCVRPSGVEWLEESPEALWNTAGTEQTTVPAPGTSAEPAPRVESFRPSVESYRQHPEPSIIRQAPQSQRRPGTSPEQHPPAEENTTPPRAEMGHSNPSDRWQPFPNHRPPAMRPPPRKPPTTNLPRSDPQNAPPPTGHFIPGRQLQGQ